MLALSTILPLAYVSVENISQAEKQAENKTAKRKIASFLNFFIRGCNSLRKVCSCNVLPGAVSKCMPAKAAFLFFAFPVKSVNLSDYKSIKVLLVGNLDCQNYWK